MSRESFRHEMKDGEKAVEVDGINFKMQMKRSLTGAERTTCDEKYDIRETSVKGDPFCPSGRKVVDRIIKSSEKPVVGRNDNLHSDTTDPGDNTVSANKGNYARSMSPSGEKNVSRQKDKAVPDAKKRKVFNS